MSVRNVDSRFAKETAASRLRAPTREARIRCIHRNSKANGEALLQRCRIEDGEICLGWVTDAVTNSLQESRSIQNRLREWLRRTVECAEQRQAISRVAGRNARQELQVVLQHHRVHRLGCDVNHS